MKRFRTSSWRWLKSELEADGRDLHLDNFGRTLDGDVCVRDLSRSRAPEAVVDALLTKIEPLPAGRALRP